MIAGETQCLYLYDVLTLIGTSHKINLFFWEEITFSYRQSGWEVCSGPAVINFVVPRQSKIVIFLEDKLLFPVCPYYWNGLPLTAAEKEQIVLMYDDGLYTLAEY